MGWFSRLFGSDPPQRDRRPAEASITVEISQRPQEFRDRDAFPEFEPIGETGAVCASCKGDLPKKPGAKAKCPLCGEFNYVRTRPHDRQKVLLSASDLPILEDQWATINGTIEQVRAVRAHRDGVRKQLADQFGSAPREDDVEWSILNADLLTHAQAEHWGLVRNCYLRMSDILRREKRFAEAARHLMTVLMYDANGAGNSGVHRSPELEKAYPTFNPRHAMWLPTIYGRVAECLRRAGINNEPAAREIFDSLAAHVYQPGRMFLTPDEVWEKIWADVRPAG